MKKLWQKLKSIGAVYIIGGVIISGAAALLLVAVVAAYAQFIAKDSFSHRMMIIVPACVAVLVVFVLLMKHFISNKFRKLRNYYFMTATIAFAASMLVMDIVSRLCDALGAKVENVDEPTSKELVYTAVSLLIILAAGIATFLLMFGLLTKNKSRYISYICEQVSKISEQSESVTIEEKGGDELETISATINRMSQQLAYNRSRERELEAQRSELITNVSHDLRSPLTSIIGYVRLLKENGIKDEQKFNEYIEVTDRRLDGLKKLVDELFELTKLDAPDFTMNFETGDASAMIKQFGFEMGMILAGQGLTLSCDIDDHPFEMMLDHERLARVFQNMFANAAKYAEPGTVVTLASRVNGSKIDISLSNRIAQGTAVDTASMFDRFYKEDRSRSDTSGAGLGLAIAKRIVELHGGSISANVQGEQITVQVTLSNDRH